jgi:hypothetical protein
LAGPKDVVNYNRSVAVDINVPVAGHVYRLTAELANAIAVVMGPVTFTGVAIAQEN